MPAYTSVPGKGHQAVKTRKGLSVRRERDNRYTGPKPKGTKSFTPEGGSVTLHKGGRVSAEGFDSRRARRRAVRRARGERKRTRRIVQRLQTEKRKERREAPKPPDRERRPEPRPQSKPKKFHGKPTAGAPTYQELSKAKRQNTLKVNKKGFVTTPKIRKAAGELKRARRAAPKATHDVGGIEDPAIRKAVIRHAPRVDKLARERYGISGEALLSKTIKGESNEQQGAVSSAKAKSITQFIPSTREDFVNRLGVDPWKDKNSAVKAATMHLDGKHGYTAGLEGYNPRGGQGYVDYILNQPVGTPTRAGKKPTKRLRRAKKQARELGLKAGKKKKEARKTPTIISVGKTAQRKFGLTVGENPAFGGVDPVHTGGSFHYSGQAIDVTGPPEKLAAFNRWVAKKFGDQVAELFYDPGISIDNGVPISPIGGHGSHVHVAIDEPGSEAYGLIAAATGNPVSGGKPFAYYGAGSTPEKARESADRAFRAALTPEEKLEKLENLGVGVGREKAEPTSAVLSTLERKYGS